MHPSPNPESDRRVIRPSLDGTEPYLIIDSLTGFQEALLTQARAVLTWTEDRDGEPIEHHETLDALAAHRRAYGLLEDPTTTGMVHLVPESVP